MNSEEALAHLARCEGARLSVGRCLEDIDTHVPYFRVTRRRGGLFDYQGFAYEKHDNAPRMEVLLWFLKAHVEPRLPTHVDISGFYNVELHDSNSYLKRGSECSCLVWSRAKHDRRSVLMPDMYQMLDYSGKLEPVDAVPWDQKSDKVAFYGTTTGNRDPCLNTRLQLCSWRAAANHHDVCDFFITQVAQMTQDSIVQKYGRDRWARMQHPWVPVTKLFDYKFNLDICGNTASWDRVPLVLHSKTLLFKAPCNDMCNYYPLLHAGTHYVDVTDTNDILKQRLYYLSNAKEAQHMITNANAFVGSYCNIAAAARYMAALLESAAAA